MTRIMVIDLIVVLRIYHENNWDMKKAPTLAWNLESFVVI